MQTRFTKPELPKTLKRYFPDFEPGLLEEMAEVGQVLEIRTGQQIMQVGSMFRSMIFVLEGSVKIFREDEDGGEFFMYSLGSGSSCALSLASGEKRETSTVKGVTLEDGIALLIPLEHMDKWLTKYKTWVRYVVGSLRERMEDILVTFDQVAFRNLDERLEFYLKRLQRELDSDVLEISHQQIATDLNTSREVISRLLKKMEQRGHISMHRNAIEMIIK